MTEPVPFTIGADATPAAGAPLPVAIDAVPPGEARRRPGDISHPA